MKNLFRVLVVIGVLVFIWSLMGDVPEYSPVIETVEEAVVFNLIGENYSFSVEEIHVKKGETVIINFESKQGFHDWVIDEFNAATDRVLVGKKTSVTFVADKVGEFEFYCSVIGHKAKGMVGKLIVE